MKHPKKITIDKSEEIELTEREEKIYQSGFDAGSDFVFKFNAIILIIVVILLFVSSSCKPHLSHREKINLDSTGQRKPNDTTGIEFSTGSSFQTEKMEVIEYTYTDLALRGKTFYTYRRNGKWTIQQPDSTMEILYQWWRVTDSIRWRPFVVITEKDTFNFYHGDTIHVGPNKDFKEL